MHGLSFSSQKAIPVLRYSPFQKLISVLELNAIGVLLPFQRLIPVGKETSTREKSLVRCQLTAGRSVSVGGLLPFW